jgi:hypothetical protein
MILRQLIRDDLGCASYVVGDGHAVASWAARGWLVERPAAATA